MKKNLLIGFVLILVLTTFVYAENAHDKELADEMTIHQKYEKLATEKGMTLEELKAVMKKPTKEEFIKKLEDKGLTFEEYQALVSEKYEKLAADKGMTLEELKASMRKPSKEDFNKMLEEKGITLEEYKIMMKEKYNKEDLASPCKHN